MVTTESVLKSFFVRCAYLLSVAVLCFSLPAYAQVQRSFINQSFESPNLGSTNCLAFLPDSQIPGWLTTHPSAATSSGCTLKPTSNNGRLIEMWTNGFQSVNAASGTQFVELNANVSSRLYQNVCLVNGEQFSWQFSHRRRATSGTESISFNIAATPTGTTSQIYRSDANASSWFPRSGTYTYNGTSGVQTLGFESLNAGSVGNFLDNIQITLTPYVEFQPGTSSGNENIPTANLPSLRVAGTLTSNVVVQVTLSGTAVLGTDYTTPTGTNSFSVTIPAGDYDSTQRIETGVRVLDDNIIELDKTIQFAMTANPGAYTIASTQSCGAQANGSATYTILDDDARIRLNKALNGNRFAAADQFSLSIAGATSASAVTTGSGSSVSGQALLSDVRPGTAYTLSEVVTGSGTINNYSPVLSCTNAKTGSPTTLPSGAGSSFSVTPARGDDISCIFTNTTKTASLTMVKTAGTPTGNTAGSTIPYTFTIRNTGQVPLSSLLITDNKLDAAASCQPSTVAPNATATCTGVHTITQAEVDAGKIDNSATATATPPGGGTPLTTPPSTTSTPLVANGALTLTKTAKTPSGNTAGSTIDYEFVIRNTGNVTISSIALSDPNIPAPGPSCPAALLAPNASMTCTGTHTVTQAEVDAGKVDNTAISRGKTPADAPVTSNEAKVSTPLTRTPSMKLTKAAGAPSGTAVGSTIAYSFRVENTGNVTLTGLTIADPKLDTAAQCVQTVLLPGAVTTCTGTHTITQDEFNAGQSVNTAKAQGKGPDSGNVDSNDSTATTPITRVATLTVQKTAGEKTGDTAGSTIPYSFIVRNTGNVTLTGVTVNDPKLDGPAVCDVTTLLPNATAICTGTHTITQAEVNAGTSNNSATASGNDPAGTTRTSPPSTTTTPLTRTPAITVEKQAGAPSSQNAGGTIAYTFNVRNTGNVTLTSVGINDPKLNAPAQCQATVLAPGATTTCTGTHTITQSEVDAGTSDNTATANGLPPAGSRVISEPSSTQTPLTRSSAISLVKTAGAPSGNTPDSTISYSFTVKNEGNVTLTGIKINDPKIPAPGPSCAVTTLAPGASTTCSGVYKITQGDIDAGEVQNSATATGTSPTGDLTSDPSGTLTPITQSKSLTVVKTAGTPSGNTAGSTIGYTFVVRNTGNVTFKTVAINDAQLDAPGAVCPAGDLTPGSEVTCTGTHTITQAEINSGRVRNTATATGTPETGDPATSGPSSTVTPIASVPSLTIAKLAGTPSSQNVGGTIAYTFNIRNTGNVTLTSVGVNDAKLDAAAVCAVTVLAPGEGTSCTGTHTITQAEVNAGQVDNTATAAGLTPNSTPVVSQPDTVTVPVQRTPNLTVQKTVTAVSGNNVGDTITYAFRVENTGNVTLTQVRINDALAGVVLAGGPIASLAPGAVDTNTFTATYTLKQEDVERGEITNTARATGTGPDNTDFVSQPSTTETLIIAAPQLSLVKTAGIPSGNSAGSTISYTFRVTNTGNIKIAGLAVTDPKISAVTCPVAALAPGEVTLCTGSYVLTQADVNAGQVDNTAVATATGTRGGSVDSNESSTSTPIVAEPDITLVKNAGTPTGEIAGSTVDFSFVVTNTGNLPLKSIALTDPQISAVTCPSVALEPQVSMTCTGTYTITQADVAKGSVVNQATVRGETDKGVAVTDEDAETVHIKQNPALEIVKTADPFSGSAVGDEITYNFKVTNTGNLDLTNVSVTETLPDVVLNGAVIGNLAANGGTSTITGTYKIKQEDINRGYVLNTAFASGTDSNNGAVRSSDSSTDTKIAQRPALTLDKGVVSGTPQQNRPGSEIQYTFTVTNSGNLPLSSIAVSDDKTDAPVSCPVTALAPGASTICTGSRALTQADINAGKVENIATVTGVTAKGSTVTSPQSAAIVTIPEEGALLTEKSVATPTGNTAGSIVRYTFKVTNTGNIPLTLVEIVDPKVQPLISGGPYTMQPGDVKYFSADYTLTQADIESGRIDNTAHSTGTTPSGKKVDSPDDSATTTVDAAPALTLVKTAGEPSGSREGAQIVYTFRVTNSGNVRIANLAIADPQVAGLVCDVQALDPKAVATCTGTHTITQAEVDAGKVLNTATATATRPDGSNPVTSNESSTETPLASVPSVELTKTGSAPSNNAEGGTISYTFTVRNTGNVTLNAIAVSDTKLAAAPSCAVTVLAPGADTTCTGTYTLTQADVDAGKVDNEATVSGMPPAGTAVTDTDDVTVTVNKTPSLTVEKTAGTPSGNTAGSTITYTFIVRNTGNVTLTDVRLNEQLAGVVLSGNPIASLAPGAFDDTTFTAVYTLTQADVNSGSVINTVTATGTVPGGGTVKDDDSVTSSIQQQPAISLAKQVVGTPGNAVGETIEYSFTVKNEGNVTLTGIAVNDPKIPAPGVSCPVAVLAPQATTVCSGTYTLTQADADAGQVDNTATVTGNPPSGDPVDGSGSTTISLQETASLTLVKTAGTPSSSAKDGTIEYTFTVTNTGTVTLANLTIADTKLPVAPSCAVTTLAPKAETTCTGTYTLTQADVDAGKVDNEATATATSPKGTEASDTDDVSVALSLTPSLTVVKTAGTPSGNTVGSTVGYTFRIENTGNVTLTNVHLNEQLAGVVLSGNPVASLAPGAVDDTTFTAVYTLTQADIDRGSVVNTVTANGTAPDNSAVTADSQVTVTIKAEGKIGLEKTAGTPSGNIAGATIPYTFKVTNEGNVTLSNITLADPKLPEPPVCETTVLAPGASMNCTGTYTLTQADIDAGKVDNEATAAGTTPAGDPVEGADTATVNIAQDKNLGLQKKVTAGDPFAAVGDTISYEYIVTNNGNVTITNAIQVADDKIAAVSCPALPQGGLAPKATLTCTATYSIVQADLDAGQVTNRATATDGSVISNEATATAQATVTPGLAVEKKAGAPSGNTVGSTIDYTFTVTNTGNVTIKGIRINDSLPDIVITGGPVDLAPGASDTTSFRATYTLTQADLNAGQVVNVATATGTSVNGNDPLTSDPSEVITKLNPRAALTVVKEAGDPSGNTVGSVIDYVFTITNTGDVDLKDVTLADALPDVVISGDPIPLLAVGQVDSTTFTARYVLKQSDLDAGQVVNSATVTGAPVNGNDPVTSDPSEVVKLIERAPKLELVKSGELKDTDGNGTFNAGDQIIYQFTVSNTGNQSISDVVPVDNGPVFNKKPASNRLGAFTPSSATLLPGGKQVFTATYVLSETDIDAGAGIRDGVVNTATATGRYGAGDEVKAAESQFVLSLPAGIPSDIVIAKRAGLKQIRRGEKAPFTITVTNKSNRTVSGVMVTDRMPSGFRYVEDSASVNGTAVTPVINGLNIRFPDLTIAANSEVVIRLQMLALSSASSGKHTNRAIVADPSGNTLAPDATAQIEIMVDPVFECGDIIGKVFDDKNGNGYQDEGEPGLPGVRVATVRGLLVTTDKYGRFHVACAALPDSRIGSNFIMKLDPRTLPTGYRVTTENPRVVRLTAGKMTKINFGASLGRVVRLSLKDNAFVSNSLQLKEQWSKGLDQLIGVLKQEHSTLRVTYTTKNLKAARQRMNAVQEEITRRWKAAGGGYELDMETRVEADK